MRQIVLDTETTGLETSASHRIIEIGGVELIDRKFTGRHFHKYINPERDIDDGAFAVHGLSAEFLRDKPLFAEVAPELLDFVRGAELIIHNAPFDITFLDYELSLLSSGSTRIADVCRITDSLALARHKHPGQKNSLDALCRRYGVDNSARTQHGALLDAEILADVYLLLTGGQTALFTSESGEDDDAAEASHRVRVASDRAPLPVIPATPAEVEAHAAWLDQLDRQSEAGSVWRRVYGA